MNEIAFICICSQGIAFKNMCVAWIFPFSLADATMCMASLIQGKTKKENILQRV